MKIEDARKEIDKIDDQIAALYDKRMDLSREIGLQKAAQGLAVNVSQREKAIVNRLTATVADEKKVFLKEVYNTIFYTSKAYQNQFVKNVSASANAIREVVSRRQSAPVSATVACQGVSGAYSSIAAEKMFQISDITYFKTFDGVFNAIDKGMCKFGVLPIENSSTGSISQVYDLMQQYNFHIVKCVRIPVKHALVAHHGTELKNIKVVLSHEQGISQCAKYLKALGVETRIVENTAVAARMVAEGTDKTVAAICSVESAAIYGLDILQSNVQDNGHNYTRFICISKDMEIYTGADKISVMINTAHTPGSLNRVLNRFAALNLNVTKLESRPISNSEFEFLFYFDFEGDVSDPQVQNLIADLENGTDRFVFLGAYKETV